MCKNGSSPGQVSTDCSLSPGNSSSLKRVLLERGLEEVKLLVEGTFCVNEEVKCLASQKRCGRAQLLAGIECLRNSLNAVLEAGEERTPPSGDITAG